jgi:peptide/nickel transport system substrate-binding protein
VDRLLDAARATAEREKRRVLYGTVQEILAEDLPYIFLWHEVRFAALKAGLRDFRLLPAGDFAALRQVHWTQ